MALAAMDLEAAGLAAVCQATFTLGSWRRGKEREPGGRQGGRPRGRRLGRSKCFMPHSAPVPDGVCGARVTNPGSKACRTGGRSFRVVRVGLQEFAMQEQVRALPEMKLGAPIIPLIIHQQLGQKGRDVHQIATNTAGSQAGSGSGLAARRAQRSVSTLRRAGGDV